MNAIQLSQENGKYYHCIGKVIVICNKENVSSYKHMHSVNAISIPITEQLVASISHLLFVLRVPVGTLTI